jgi:hypothetical protein
LKKEKHLDVTVDDVNGVIQVLNEVKKSNNLNEKQTQALNLGIRIIGSFLYLISLVNMKKSSIKKLKAFIFGNKSEKSKSNEKPKPGTGKKGLGGGSSGSDGGSTSNQTDTSESSEDGQTHEDQDDKEESQDQENKKSSDDEKGPRKGGTGHISHEDYEATFEVVCHLRDQHQPGRLCPECKEHKLYNLKASCTIRLIGSPPVEAVRFVQKKSACICGVQFIGEVPEEYSSLFENKKYSASALSAMIHLKYDLGVPFGSIESYQSNSGVPLAASTQSNKIREQQAVISAVFEEIEKAGANMDLIGMDDTPIKILEGRQTQKNTKTLSGHGTVMLCGQLDQSRQAVLYYLNFKHAGQCLLDFLALRDEDSQWPICICDGAPCYEGYVESSEVISANCNSHSRRKFFPERDSEILCGMIIDCYRQIYKNEKYCRESGLNTQQRLLKHQVDSQKPLETLLSICKFITSDPGSVQEILIREELKLKPTITPSEPNSDLYRDAKYVIDRWEKLTNFTRHPGVPLDTNMVEIKIKAIIEIRKKGLFF